MKFTCFLILLLSLLSCSNIYKKGDRLYKKSDYKKAVETYRLQLKKNDISQTQKNTLLYKISLSNHKLGNNKKALEDLKAVKKIPSNIECDFYDLKLKLFNEIGDFKKTREFSQILERIDRSGCIVNGDELDRFYSGLRKLYYPRTIRAGDRFLIRGNLKLDLKDELSALNYFRKALIENPDDPEYLQKLLKTFEYIKENIVSKFEKKQRSEFYLTDFPRFYEFLSKLYHDNKHSPIPASSEVIELLNRLTDDFIEVKTTKPIPIYNSYNFQDRTKLIKTYSFNESLKMRKIDADHSLSKYIVFSRDDFTLGITAKIQENSFIEVK